eukprot:TRINITY_DN8715_c0_g1_i2.p1 TRINITY_DN8715_c0_g1~~TRINITY_DN8715_c0_g1_i2.p1  ORF type:complete len:351 (-),score=54.29 TRINITY_DN8715_c0_g1_i2:24-1076(-)
MEQTFSLHGDMRSSTSGIGMNIGSQGLAARTLTPVPMIKPAKGPQSSSGTASAVSSVAVSRTVSPLRMSPDMIGDSPPMRFSSQQQGHGTRIVPSVHPLASRRGSGGDKHGLLPDIVPVESYARMPSVPMAYLAIHEQYPPLQPSVVDSRASTQLKSQNPSQAPSREPSYMNALKRSQSRSRSPDKIQQPLAPVVEASGLHWKQKAHAMIFSSAPTNISATPSAARSPSPQKAQVKVRRGTVTTTSSTAKSENHSPTAILAYGVERRKAHVLITQARDLCYDYGMQRIYTLGVGQADRVLIRMVDYDIGPDASQEFSVSSMQQHVSDLRGHKHRRPSVVGAAASPARPLP